MVRGDPAFTGYALLAATETLVRGAGSYNRRATVYNRWSENRERKKYLTSERRMRGAFRSAAAPLHVSIWPPSTTSVCPVIQLASSEARNSTALATSSGIPNRPNGIVERTRL